MNPLQQLKQMVAARFPTAVLSLEAPVREGGVWSLDIGLDGHALVVAWKPSRGFGVSSLDRSVFGEGHDETFGDLDTTWNRVRALLLAKGNTQPPIRVQLKALRESLGTPQAELAEMLAVGQAAVSKLESRSDILVSTLASVVAALGGQLEIIARFRNRRVDLLASPPQAKGVTEKRKAGKSRKPKQTRSMAR